MSEKSIRDNIQNGSYSSEIVEVVRDEKKSFVRQLKRPDTDTIPASVVQIHNTVIYQADLHGFVDALIKSQSDKVDDDLNIQYREVLEGLKHYRDLEGDLDILNSDSRKATAAFGFRSSKLLKPTPEFMNNPERGLRVLDSYANIIFIYVMSGYWRYREKFANDTSAITQLESLKSEIQPLYEWLLQQGDNDDSVAQSVYAHIFLDQPDDIKLIGKLVEYDNRYNTDLDFFQAYSKKCLDKAHILYDQPYIAKRPHPGKSNVNSRLELALELHNIIVKIDNIRDVFMELKEAGKIDESHVIFSEEALASPLSIFRIETKQKS
ncbi:hypothetical protein B1R45_29220 [Pseudomonas azotoformans]|nr:hypothetical protein B1R45_29220 [Pseudomonas azotoformans]